MASGEVGEMMVTATIVEYRLWGSPQTAHTFLIHKQLNVEESLAHIVRTHELLDEAMVDVLTIKYVFAPQRTWAKEPA
jgi:hypothetical protein